jgi:hypothetical protein
MSGALQTVVCETHAFIQNSLELASGQMSANSGD